MKFIILCFAFFVCTKSSVLPVEKCSLEDKKCLTTQFQKAVPVFMAGIPELGVEVLDVMDMEDFKFDLSGLQFSLKDGKLKGLKNSVIDGVKWDTKKKTFQVIFHLDCTVKGHYIAAGRILILPITGDGDMKLKLKNVQITFDIDYDVEKKDDGKDYVVPKKLHFDFDVRDNANFHLTNLFNGNKQLSDPMLVFLNENWKQISLEFGRPMLEVAAKSIYKNIKMFFKKNPISDIANIN